MISDLEKRLADKRLSVTVTERAKQYLIDNGYDPVYGARPLRRFLQSHLETVLARKMIAEDLAPDTHLTVDEKDGQLTVSVADMTVAG